MIPATCVPWNDCSRSSGELFAPGPAKPRAAITFGVVEPVMPFGKPGRVREAGRAEERVLVVDAVVDDRDLDPFAPRSGQPREGRRAENGRPAVQVEAVRVARVHALDERQPRAASGSRSYGRLIAKPLTSTWYRRLTAASRDLRADARDRPCLRGLEPAKIRARERGVHVQLHVGAEAGQPRARRSQRRAVGRRASR